MVNSQVKLVGGHDVSEGVWEDRGFTCLMSGCARCTQLLILIAIYSSIGQQQRTNDTHALPMLNNVGLANFVGH